LPPRAGIHLRPAGRRRRESIVMPSTHHRITRKELKRPDEFVSIVESAEEFFLNNLRQVIISAVVVLAVASVAAGTYFYEVHRDRTTANQFYTALKALNGKNYDTAAQDFVRLAQAEPNRCLGRLARFYAGLAYLGQNDLPHARDALIAFLGEEHDPTYLSLARTDLAVVYEKMGEFSRAENEYRQASAVPGPEQARAELGVARMMMQQGNSSGAIEVYRQFLAEHPFSEQREEVLESLAMLGAPASAPAPKKASALAPGQPLPVLAPAPAAPAVKPN
jgi:predicted negative regulator of RcsB-dependent stress response